MANLVALKAEFTLNPAVMAYLPFVDGNDVANAAVINNTLGLHPRTVNRETVDTGVIRGTTSYDGFDGLVTASRQWFEWLTVNGVIPVNAETLQRLAGKPTATGSIWNTQTRTAMNAAMTALMQYQGSRAQEIAKVIGADSVSPADVRDARQLV